MVRGSGLSGRFIVAAIVPPRSPAQLCVVVDWRGVHYTSLMDQDVALAASCTKTDRWWCRLRDFSIIISRENRTVVYFCGL